jgi:ATP-dependent Lon protease
MKSVPKLVSFTTTYFEPMPAQPVVRLPERVPVVPLRSTIVYPLGVIGVQIGMPSTLEMLAAHGEEGLIAAVVVAPGGPDDPIDARELRKIGVVARLADRLNMPGGSVQATIQGLSRIRLTDVEETHGFFTARIEQVEETLPDDAVAEECIARILTKLEYLAAEVDRIPREVPRILRMNVADPSRFADLVATLTNFSLQAKDEIVQRLDVRERLQFALEELEGQTQRVRRIEEAEESQEQQEAEAEAEAGGPASRTTTQPTRRHTSPADLRRKIQLLQSELGEVDPLEREAIELFRRIEATDLPARVATRARTEVEHLRAVGSSAAEASEIRSYIDWLLHFPWHQRSSTGPENIDLGEVERAMEAALIGLEEPKQRLLDYLAVAKLRGDLRGPIPCIVGPADVGKTTLVQALAEGMGRPITWLELGGRGEGHLVGSRRTRAGAQAGKIAAAIRDVGVRDPVFLLEDMDELGLGKVEGDPTEALEEALSWESRGRFVDRYLDLEIDLSEVLFIATAQDFYRIPRDLRDLMVELRIAGYTAEEKVQIARNRLLARMIEEHGLAEHDIQLDDDALFFLARAYARDSGLGLLIRYLATILRTRARAKADGDHETWSIGRERIEQILGLPRYIATVAESAPEIGVVTGLAWTAAGGELMFIEALRMPGSGRLIITGLLGDVMRESVNAAYSYARSREDTLGIDDSAFRDSDLHVHFPVGATPKDGPSAGIAVTLAIASTLSNRAVRHDVAMTGEVTLRGKVLEVGGIKEKVLAAYRAGLREVIMPRGNERDLRDVPQDVRESIRFHLVDVMDDVIRIALLPQGVTAAPVTAAPDAVTAVPARGRRAAAGPGAPRKPAKPKTGDRGAARKKKKK